jgi:GT2 family glycosyltransferase
LAWYARFHWAGSLWGWLADIPLSLAPFVYCQGGQTKMIVASVVCHGQNELAAPLIRYLIDCEDVGQVILTCNIPDSFVVESHPKLEIIFNNRKQCFGKNHNQALLRARALAPHAEYFCVLNPDITIHENPFRGLLSHFVREDVALVAPAILSPQGGREDSARVFPTFFGLVLKALGLTKGVFSAATTGEVFEPDWVAGMFMVLKIKDFEAFGGFDDKYFLYYEDVDLCWRLRRGQKTIVCDPRIGVVHDARRQSRRNLVYLSWHFRSALRFFAKRLFC